MPNVEPKTVTEVVRAVLTTISDELTAKKTSLLREVEKLGHTIALAKAEIAKPRVDNITGHGIPFAMDELEAIVDHTALATHAILESARHWTKWPARSGAGRRKSRPRQPESTKRAASSTSPDSASPRP